MLDGTRLVIIVALVGFVVLTEIIQTGGRRSGELSFRAQRMTLPMLESFRLEIAHISLYLDLEDGDSSEKHVGYTGARQYPKPNEFVQLTAKVTNLTGVSFSSFIHPALSNALHSTTCCLHTRPGGLTFRIPNL